MEVLGWRDIGYHWLIERDAAVREGRPVSAVGAHCQGDNADSIGVCLVGRGNAFPLDRGYMTFAMFVALLGLLKRLQGEYPEIGRRIFGHRERPSGVSQRKSCPGWDCEIIRGIL